MEEKTEMLIGLPKGAVILWASRERIPNGWAVCDGHHDTPNLVDKFVRGGKPEHLNTPGGIDKIDIDTTTADTGFCIGNDQYKSDAGSDARKSPGLVHGHKIKLSFDNKPAFVTLVYIMKL